MARKNGLTAVADLLKKSHFDRVVVSHKNKTIKVKNFFFYTHGQTVEGLYNKVDKILRENNIHPNDMAHNMFWNLWPKNSWFEVLIYF